MLAPGPAGVPAWFWIGNALEQATEIAPFCALVTLFAVFPDGVYHRTADRRIVRAVWLLVPITPLVLLLTRPTLYINTYAALVFDRVPSPLFVSAMA